MIYAIYHFPTGKWYVGQTIGNCLQRLQSLWRARHTCTDLFHNALQTDATPYSMHCMPLELLPFRDYTGRLVPHQRAKNNFRRAAHARERYWTSKLMSMYPNGYNSSWPGHPVAALAHSHRPAHLPEGTPKADLPESQGLVSDLESKHGTSTSSCEPAAKMEH